jgi:hypothetical protein
VKKLLVTLLVASGCQYYEENLGFTVVGEPRWAISLGGRAGDRGMLVAFDSIGDVVVAGDFIGPADFGSGLDGAGGPWPYITKRVASDGAERWTRRLVGLNSMAHIDITAMTVTPQDEVVVTGTYVGSVDFGGQTLALAEPNPPDHGDMFIAKYATQGGLLWVHGLAEYSNATGTALAVDAAGGLYAAAIFSGTVVLDGQTFQPAPGQQDMLLFAYNSDGTRRWFHVFDDVRGARPRSLALATNGDVLVGGSFDSPASFGGAVIDPAARVRGFLTRFRNDGLYLASFPVGPVAPYVSWGPDIRVDSDGHLVLQQVEVDESDGALQATQGSTLRVLDDAGNELWTTPIENHGRYSPQSRALLTTPSGLIATAAWTDNPTTAAGNMEILTFADDGSNTVSAFGNRMALGSDPGTFAFGGAVSSTGALAFTGQFGGMIDFGTGPMTTRGQNDTDAFIVVVDPPTPH